MSIQRNNHYIPCLYLKHFASSPRRVLTYRVLVGDARVPVWQEKSIKGVGYHSHLYTRIAAGAQTDEMEKWLNTEFESPAEEALVKATSDARLLATDWHKLVRFLAAQDVRTPARLSEKLLLWNKSLPALLEATLQQSVLELEEAKKAGQAINPVKTANSEYIPLRVTRDIEPGQEFGKLKSEVIVGRGLWLFSMRHALATTANILPTHRWTILRPPDNLTWFTSDDPVVRLNYHADGTYDFGGGWGSPGTEIFLPLDPLHLLYAKVGERPPPRGFVLPRATAEMIRRFIAEHAHRFVFAAKADAEVPKLRPRRVDAVLLRDEREQWLRWHDNQNKAEEQLSGSGGATR